MAARKTPGSPKPDKLMKQALLLELHQEAEDASAAGGMTKRLRLVARKLVDRAMEGDVPAIREIYDRIDGKVPQDSTVTIDDKRDSTDWTRDELVAFLNDARAGGDGVAKTNGSGRGPDSVH